MVHAQLRSVILCLLAFLLPAGAAFVEDFGAYPGETQGNEVTVTVDGTPVFVHTHNGGALGPVINYVHFSFTGSSQIRVTASTMVNDVRPKALGIPISRSGNTLTFTIDRPFNYVVLRKDDLPPNWYYEKQILLCIFAEAPMTDVPSLSDATVHNIKTYSVDSTGTAVETQKINDAISAISAAGGGTLYFTKGIYTTGTVRMKDNVQVWVATGALVRASTSTSDFPTVTSASRWGNHAFFYWDHTVNARLRGHGTLDMRKTKIGDPRHQMFAVARRCVMEGVQIANSAVWTIHPTDCDSLTFRNVHVLNQEPCCYVDQFDIDACRDVLLENCFSYGGDDATCIKSVTATPKVFKNFTVRNSTFWSTTSNGLRAGGGAEENNWTSCTNILYNNVHFLHAGEHAVCFMLGQTGLTRDIRFSNCSTEDQHMDAVHIADECWGGGCAHSNATVFKNALFDNYTVSVASSGSGGIPPNMTITYGDSIQFNCLKVNGSAITAKPSGYTITVPGVYFGCQATQPALPARAHIEALLPAIRMERGTISCTVCGNSMHTITVTNVSGEIMAHRTFSGPGVCAIRLDGAAPGILIVNIRNSKDALMMSSRIMAR
jgi:hypothetical protein